MFNRLFGTPNAKTDDAASNDYSFSLPSITFNPLNSIGYKRIKYLALGSLTLLQHVQSASANAIDVHDTCLEYDTFIPHGTYAVRNADPAIPPGSYHLGPEDNQIHIIAETCDYDIYAHNSFAPTNDLSPLANTHSLLGFSLKNYGCQVVNYRFITPNFSAEEPDIRLMNFINDHCPQPDDGPFITFYDIAGLVGISAAGVCVLGTVSYHAFKTYKEAHAPNPIRNIEQGLLDEDTREEVANNWEALEERIEALAESHPEQSRELFAAFTKALDDFKCPIGYVVMSDPVTLPCSHNFDKESLLNNLRREDHNHAEHTCAMCRDEVDPNEIKSNETLKAAIECKYRYFDREATRLENLSIHTANVSLSRSGSSLFTSVKSEFSSSKESEEEQELNLAGASTLNSCGIM